MFGYRFWAVSQKTQRRRQAGLWLALGLLVCRSGAQAAPTPGTVVTTEVTASYALADSSAETSQSNPASFVVDRVGGVTVQPASATLQAASGQTVCAFPLQIQNTGAGSDNFVVTIAVPDGWSGTLVRDNTGDGVYQQSGTMPIAQPIALAAGQTMACFLRVTAPASLESGGTAVVRLTSQADPTQTAQFAGTVQAAPAMTGVLQIGWRVQTGGPVLGEATVWQGVAYVGSDDGAVYAIAATPDSGALPGTVLWRRQTNARVRCTPAVYVTPLGQAQVTAGNDAGRLTTWDTQTGRLLWSSFVGGARGTSWRARPLVSPDGSLVTVAGNDLSLWSLTTARGQVRRRAFWSGLSIAGNPALSDADGSGGGAWVMGASGWGALVRSGLPTRRLNLGSRAAGALVMDTAQACLVGVTAGGRVTAFDPVSLLPDPRWPAGGGNDLGSAVWASPALDADRGLLYIAAANHQVYALHTADGTTGASGWPFTPSGPPGAAFRAAPLLWPSQDSAAPTLYVGDTGGQFYAVPTDRPAQALVFTPEPGTAPVGEWDAAPAASGTGPQDVVVAGNTDGAVYGFHLR